MLKLTTKVVCVWITDMFNCQCDMACITIQIEANLYIKWEQLLDNNGQNLFGCKIKAKLSAWAQNSCQRTHGQVGF